MTGFTLQETIISGLYLYEARRILRPGTVFQKKKTTECLRHLIWVNVCIIFMDAALLATEYAGLFSIQTVFKAAIYSVKLRFEFVVLNDLMEIVGGRNASVFSQGRDYTSSDGNNTGDVQLGAVNSRAGQQSGNHYSANAGRGAGFPASGPRTKDHGGVMRTTEVQVQDTPKSGVVESQVEVHPSEHDDRTQYGEAITTSSRRRASSRASSEIEFAGKGAYPS